MSDEKIEAVARALAEVDGIRYWKFDPGPIRNAHQERYVIFARRFIAATDALRTYEIGAKNTTRW
jgi:hypothetical protein